MKKVELIPDKMSVDWTPEEDEAFAELEARVSKLWPFPTKLPPSKPGETKFNPDNFEDAPL
jgi:hypothetical protein